MRARVEVPRADFGAVLDHRAQIVAVEGPAIPGASDFYDCGERGGEDYIVLHFSNGATLYADAPTLYHDSEEVPS